ncbi:hypothetical protein L6232_23035, partial [Shewanella sp. C31]|nr:hypothetical protein [Shewanella electrica]
VIVSSASASRPTLYKLLPLPSDCPDPNVTIGCLVTSFLPPPVTVTWTTGGAADATAVTSLPVATTGGTYSLTTALTVPREQLQGNEFVCRAQHAA